MNRIAILLFSLLMTAAALCAQQTLKVSYNVTNPTPLAASVTQNKMLLVASADNSLYYHPASIYVDSLSSTPEGQAELKRLLGMEGISIDANGQVHMNINENIHKKVPTYVAKNFSDGALSVYDKWSDEDGTYQEPLGEMQWTILEDSTKNVLGYECVLAVTDYHGRTWNAWFAPEIPLSDGPWKFRNLPGLVLMAQTPDSTFSFEATGIENFTGAFPKIYGQDQYSRVDRKEALAANEKYLDNIENVLSAQHGKKATMVVIDKDGKALERRRFDRQKDAIETDY